MNHSASNLATIDPKNVRRRYRMLMVAIGFLYPSWRFMAYYYNPNALESWEQRGMMGVLFLSFSLISFRSQYFREQIANYFNIIGFVWLVQTMFLLYANPDNFEYQLMAVVVIFTIGSSFLDKTMMLWFYLLSLALTGAYVLNKPDLAHINFLWGVIVALSASYIGLRSLLSLFHDLAKNKRELQKRTDEYHALSAAVQTLFLPKRSDLQNARWKLSGFYRPVDSCGGDWWTYFESAEKLTIILGDITGHGPGSAMMTASIASYTKALQAERANLSVVEMLDALNRYLIELQSETTLGQQYLMTIHAIEIDFATNSIQSYSAGAPSISILSADNKIRTIGNPGNPVGFEPQLKIGIEATTFVNGDRFLFYSDGILEVNANGKTFSERKMLQLACKDRDLQPQQAVGRLIDRLDKFRGSTPQEDDYTLVILDVAS